VYRGPETAADWRFDLKFVRTGRVDPQAGRQDHHNGGVIRQRCRSPIEMSLGPSIIATLGVMDDDPDERSRADPRNADPLNRHAQAVGFFTDAHKEWITSQRHYLTNGTLRPANAEGADHSACRLRR
jgi:hypothetical protein